MRSLRLAATLVALACAEPGTALSAPKAWISPGGRYVAQFPSSPKESSATMQGGKAVVYTAMDVSAVSTVIYQLAVTSFDDLKRRPTDEEVRELLKSTFDFYIASMGADPANQEVTWARMDSAGPVLNYRASLKRDSARFVSEGFFLLDDISMVRMSVAYLAHMHEEAQAPARQFLKSFVVLAGKKKVPIGDFVRSVATGAGGRLVGCPVSLRAAIKRGLLAKGLTFLGMECASFKAQPGSVQNRVDEMLRGLSFGSAQSAWTADNPVGASKASLYDDAGVEWKVHPAIALPIEYLLPKEGSILVATMMK